MEPLVEPQFAQRAAVPAAAGSGACAKPRSTCCKRPSGRSSSPVAACARPGAARELVALAEALADSGRDLAQRQGHHPRHASAVGRRRRQLFARKRQPRRQPRRSRLLHRHRDRRHDHAFLGGAEDRHAGDPDRHRAGIARPQLSAAGQRAGRRQGGARRRCWRRPTRPAPKNARPGSRRSPSCARLGGQIQGACWNPMRCRSTRRASAAISPSMCRTTPSSSSTPAMPACGWAACTTLRVPTQSYIRSAGHLGWAFCAGLGAKAACPDRPVVVFTGDAGFWYHIGEIETAVRWKINSVTVVNNNGGGNQSKRGFDRAYGGEQTEQARELWTYQQDELRQDRRGHGRARHPRREAGGFCAGAWQRRWPPTGRSSSTSSPTSTRWRRPRSLDPRG